MDLVFLHNTKVGDGVYTLVSSGYSIIATNTLIQHRGGAAVFYFAEPWFIVEALHQFGTDVVRFHLVLGGRKWYILVCYLAPYNASTIERVVNSIGQIPCGTELLISGNFIAYLAGPGGSERYKDVLVALATVGLEDGSEDFLPQR